MRRFPIAAIALVVLLSFVGAANASFHIMQIERVIAGVDGDVTAQAIQLRMRAVGQNFVSLARIRAWNANGTQRVVIVDMGSDVASGALGDRVLIASANFLNKTSPATVPDFVMTTTIPASYLPAGSLTFESDTGVIYWRLSWGGGAYTGLTTGNIINDADGDYGKLATTLPTGFQALFFVNSASAPSTTNSADYAVSPGVGIFTNNAGTAFPIVNTASAAGSLPARTALYPNYPNPFNPATAIPFALRAAGPARIAIYDATGRRVATLLDGTAPAGPGEVRWDGRDDRGAVMATGVYYVRLEASGESHVRKMVLLK